MENDFFISYNRADKDWAEWIAWQLEGAGYTTVLQVWDFRPGGNVALEMQRASARLEAEVALANGPEDGIAEWAVATDTDGNELTGTKIELGVGYLRQSTGSLSGTGELRRLHRMRQPRRRRVRRGLLLLRGTSGLQRAHRRRRRGD